jgi:uncharacterized protein YndB with AHSA1/START domain
MLRFAALTVLACVSAGASAAVTHQGDNGFATHDEAVVAASSADAWIALTDPAGWWNPEHSWSGNAANFTLFPVAGGCFCEELPESGGSVEHMRVVHAVPDNLLRLSGGLGPLQAEALAGTLTITLEPVEGGTKIGWDYVVSGFARFDLAGIAPVVDGVQSEQLGRLADKLGRKL